jgi:hypothetical protein
LLAAAALRAKGEDLVSAGHRHGKGDEAAAVSEIERRRLGGWVPSKNRQQDAPASRRVFIVSPFLMNLHFPVFSTGCL